MEIIAERKKGINPGNPEGGRKDSIPETLGRKSRIRGV